MTNETQQERMVVIPPRNYSNYLSDLGSYASIVGLFITILVFINLKKVRNQFLFQARYPALKKAISSHSDTLSKHLNAFPESLEDIESELQPCLANLKNLKVKLTGPTKKSVQQLIIMISDIPRPLREESKQGLRNVYSALVGLETELKNLSEDQKWKGDK